MNDFFKEIGTIIENYKKKRKSGDDFNIFEILKLSTNEVRTHSAFIAELLNPFGSHGCTNLFVKEFIKLFIKSSKKENDTTQFDDRNIKAVYVEYWLGKKIDSEGGFIDVLLQDKNNRHIIIENKINAGDQENQLLRYHNFDKEAPIIYLTLDGRLPDKYSTGENKSLEKKLICLSYRTEIIKWLNNIINIPTINPIVKNAIEQYVNLIKKLTNQNMEAEEKNAIVKDILNNDQKIDILKQLSENFIWDETRKTILKELGDKIFNSKSIIKTKLGLNCKFNDNSYFGKKGFDFWFYKDSWNFCIYFVFQNNFDFVSFGIDNLNSSTPLSIHEKQNLTNKLQNFRNPYEDEEWIWKSDFEDYNENWSWQMIYHDGEDLFYKFLKEMVEVLEN